MYNAQNPYPNPPTPVGATPAPYPVPSLEPVVTQRPPDPPTAAGVHGLRANSGPDFVLLALSAMIVISFIVNRLRHRNRSK
jgi:hypothetical protein